MLKNIGKYAGVLAGLGFLLASVSLISAQTTAKEKLEIMEQRKIQALKNFATTTAKQKLEEIEKQVEEKKQNLEKIREEAQTKIKEVRGKAQNKIREIRDEQKKKQAEQIENQFTHLNKVWTDHFTQLLNKYEAVLQKIKNRADKAAANSIDVSEVDAQIKKAETAITAARTAVETQAKKTYTVDITAVNSGIATTTNAVGQNQLIKNLKEQFKAVKTQLEKDLKALRDGLMKNAKDAVHSAFQTLAKIPKVDEEKEIKATSTPSQ